MLSLRMHVKPLFAHRLQTAKMACRAQNNGPRAQSVLQFEPKMLFLYLHASFAHRLQKAKMSSSCTSAQNNGPTAQKAQSVSVVLKMLTHACETLVCAPFTDRENGFFSRQCAK